MAKHFSEVKRELEQPDGHMADTGHSKFHGYIPANSPTTKDKNMGVHKLLLSLDTLYFSF